MTSVTSVFVNGPCTFEKIVNSEFVDCEVCMCPLNLSC